VCLAAIAALVCGAGVGADAPSRDWPQFRGENRDGASEESGLLDAWPEGGPKELWRVPLGDGYSGISIVGERVYTMFAAGGEGGGEAQEFAAAFDAASGKELWRTPVDKKYTSVFGDGPRSTPAVHDGAVYVLSSYGQLLALSAQDGAERWRLNLGEAFGSKVPGWGFSNSALADGDLLLIEGGGKEGKSYAALDRATGGVRWTYGDGPDEPSYNSPIRVSAGGKTRYVYLVGDKLRAVDGEGREIWSHPWTHPGETHATPIFVPPNRIFASGAEGVGASLVEFSEAGDQAEVKEIWKSAVMRNHFSSSVVHDGHVYGFDNASLRSVALDSGESKWIKRGLGKGSLIRAGTHLVVLSDTGKLVLVEATPSGYVEKGSVQALEGRCWTAPSLAHGRLYLRNHEQMVSYAWTR
jgi:outer membrane protein assembly factor BamB